MIAVRTRRLQSGDTDHELLWLLVGAGLLCCAWIWRRLPLPWPHCVFHRLTGFPCPTCGATRCLLLLAHGRFGGAFAMNPLAFCALFATGLFAIYAAAVLLLRLPRIRVSADHRSARLVRIAAAAALAANWGYLILAGRA